MNLSDMSKPLTAAYLNETASKLFGKRLRLESFNMEQLYDARNKLRTKMHQSKTNENYNKLDKDESYHRNAMFLDIINAEINERENSELDAEATTKNKKPSNIKPKNNKKKRVTENTEDEAELIMAAKDMVDKLTGWMEHTAQMQSETILSLGDSIRIEMGSGYSRRFVKIVKPALEEMYSSMEETRQKLISGVELLSGEKEYDMGEEPIEDFDDDEFGASEVSKGGKSSIGREKRESVKHSMRNMISEKKKVKESEYLDELDERILEVIHYITNTAKEKNKQAFIYFDDYDKSEYGNEYLKFDLNKIMRNIGGETYDRESFEELCDAYPQLEEMIDEYNDAGIIVNSSDDSMDDDMGDDEKTSDENKHSKIVSSAAKRAANKALKK